MRRGEEDCVVDHSVSSIRNGRPYTQATKPKRP